MVPPVASKQIASQCRRMPNPPALLTACVSPGSAQYSRVVGGEVPPVPDTAFNLAACTHARPIGKH
eukprot:2214577-Alexandrium_andersonii.AAC.1